MFYRENGQFKTSYQADQQIFPIAQDRWAILAIVAFAAIGVPLLVDEYFFRAILIPFLILALASLGVFIRDLPQVVTLVVGLLQFLSPVFYPVSSLPADVQGLASWNPLTVYMEQIRAWVFAETQPTWGQWSHSLLITGVLLVSGYALFRRLKKGFADVI